MAISMVVLCHAVEQVYSWDVNYITNLSMQSRIFAFAAFTIGRLGVPIFMFITGYLLLTRDFDENGIKSFWKKNLLPLLITTEIWIVLYDIFLKFFHSQPFKWSLLVKNVLFLEQVKMGHMWYMSMILGVYLFIPFVSRVIKNIKVQLLVIPLIVVTIYLTIFPLINFILLSNKKSGFWPILVLDYSGGYYGLIFILGYLYKRYVKIENLNGNLISLVGFFAYLLIVMLQLFYFSKELCCPVWYNWFPLIIASGCLAIVTIKISKSFILEDCAIIQLLGKCAFGVYLVHFPLLMTLNYYFPWNILLPVKVISLFIVGLFLSYAIVVLLSRFKRIKTTLLYIK